MLAYSVAVISAITAGATYAAEEVEEITVTAQRRAESIQEVPLAVSAFTGAFVQQTNLDDIKDLVKYTPGVTGDSHDSFIDTISVRGIVTNDFGVGGDPSIGVFKNNLYQGRNGEVVTTLYDLDRAEILRARKASCSDATRSRARSACSRSDRTSKTTTVTSARTSATASTKWSRAR